MDEKNKPEQGEGSLCGRAAGKLVGAAGCLCMFVTIPLAALAIPAGLLFAVGCVVAGDEVGKKLGLP